MPYDFNNSEAEQLIRNFNSTGYTQAGVNRVYELLGLGAAPTVPQSLIGRPLMGGRVGERYSNGAPIPRDARSFLNTFGTHAVDPYRQYGVGNYLGVAGLLAGGYGALSGAGAAAAPGASASAPSSLGIFGNGGAAGMAGVGAGNAGALAASGGIAGGAGIGGTAAGALGGLSGLANGISGAGGSMGWRDWVGPAITVAGSLIGSRQANDASRDATRVATDEQRRQFDLVRSDTAGQRALGDSAVSTLARYYGFNTGPGGTAGTPDRSVFTQSPDYQFNLAEGQRGLDRSLVARSGALSGAGAREGIRYASGMASRENAAFVDRLMQAAGVGSTGIGASASAGANAANNIGAYAVNAGNNRASTYMNNAANINNAIQTGYSNTLLRNYLGG